jgi:hypothetical protein
VLFHVVVYSAAIALTAAIAALSYHFFERPFLELKKKFSPAVLRPEHVS